MASIRLFISESFDAWFNLRLKRLFFAKCQFNSELYFFGAVVIGRAQNPWKECNPRKMAQDSVKLSPPP